MTQAPTAAPTVSPTHDDFPSCCLFCPRITCDAGTYDDNYGYNLTGYDPDAKEHFKKLFHKCCGGHCNSVRCPSPEEELQKGRNISRRRASSPCGTVAGQASPSASFERTTYPALATQNVGEHGTPAAAYRLDNDMSPTTTTMTQAAKTQERRSHDHNTEAVHSASCNLPLTI